VLLHKPVPNSRLREAIARLIEPQRSIGAGAGGPEEMLGISRREAMTTLAATALAAGSSTHVAADQLSTARARMPRFRIRTLTAGVRLDGPGDTGPVESALAFLKRAKQRVIDAGYEVQTIRVAMNPQLLDASARVREAALPQLATIDRMVAEASAVASIGPVFSRGTLEGELSAWGSELIRSTKSISFSVAVATPGGGVNTQAARAAAEIIVALSRALPGGVGNFRFAAAANIPAGTPFFPVAWHDGDPTLAVGLETANIVHDAFSGTHDANEASERLRHALNEALAPVEKLAQSLAHDGKRQYLGIDSSPAPGADSSIGGAIEALTGVPFGSAATLQACAAITGAIKTLHVQTCGYSGLMLPILEDPVLAQRASEGRIRVSELLLFSSVCGTGLDVVPLAGDASADSLGRLIGDVATLAHRLRKPLSARLFPVPGKTAGETATFNDPLLFACKTLPLD
jgi:hypothetical protein